MKIVLAFVLALLAPQAFAQAPAQPVLGKIEAHPALWTVHGPKGTAYLFGAIHILPPNMQWHTPQVKTAMKASDVFVFEVPLDAATQASIANFVRDNGRLPGNETLPSLMNDETRKDYRAALAVSGVSGEGVKALLRAAFVEVAARRAAEGRTTKGEDDPTREWRPT